MSRANNSVRLIGKVVKGPYERYTKEGKLRIEYQLLIEGKKVDNGHVQAPFIRSLGNQAEKDKENIKTGDLVMVEGKLITRMEKKRILLGRPDKNSQILVPVDPDDEEGPVYDDEDLFEVDIVRPVTEVFADDVMYFHEFLSKMSEAERKKIFSNPRLLEKIEEDLREE